MITKPVRVGYFADGPWAHLFLDALLSDCNIRVCFICVRYENPDPVLMEKGKQYGIDVLRHPNINSDEFYGIINQYNSDLFASMSFDQIFRRRLLDMPPLGAVNCHAGKLPFYRGRNVLNWALINDEPEFGITVHYIDEGIDTGDIILQETHPISDSDTYSTLLDRAYEGCASLLYKAVCQIMDGTAQRVSQSDIDPVGMYCGMRGPGDERINWNQSSRALFNFIRAITRPGPGAVSYIDGKIITIYKARMVEGARSYINTPGQILGKTKDGFLVKTQDTVLEILDYEYEGSIRIGMRLVSIP